MLTSFIALFFLLTGSLGFAGIAKRKPEECIPVCISCAVFWLFLAYCMGVVRIGLVLLCILFVLLFLLALKEKTISIRSVCTPGMIVWVGLCLLFICFLSDNLVRLHDELRLWGAVPKAIHMTGKLQLGKDVHTFSIMQSYLPGLPLIEYFFSAFTESFSEGALYIGYSCVAMAFLMPSLAQWNWKQWPLAAIVWLVFILTPCIFTSHNGDHALFGVSLFVDPLLGIVAGYIYFMASQKPFADKFRLLSFCSGIGMLCLLKNTGIVFAAAAIICAVILDNASGKWRCVIALLVIAATAGLWKGMQIIYHVRELVPLQVHSLSNNAVSNVLHALVSENIIAHGIPLGPLLSFSVVFSILIALYAVASLPYRQKKTAWVIGIGIIGSTAAFIYGYALIYGETLESFTRYMSTVMLCLFTVILYYVIPLLCNSKVIDWLYRRSGRCRILLAGGCIFAGIAVFAVWSGVYNVYGDMEEEHISANLIRDAVLADMKEGKTGRVYLVMAGDGVENSHTHHRIFFELISENIRICNGFAKTQVVIPGLDNPAEIWAQELRDGCDYVYLLTVEDALRPVFAQFSDADAVEHGLYRVCESDNSYGISLEPVAH